MSIAINPGTYAIDPAHTEVGFVARHAMVTKVRGYFRAVRPQDAAGLHRAIAAGETQLGGARVLVFGHAILEHAVLGAPLPRAAPVVLCDPEPDGPLSPLVARLDDALAAYMGAVTGAPMPPALALDALDADARP